MSAARFRVSTLAVLVAAACAAPAAQAQLRHPGQLESGQIMIQAQRSVILRAGDADDLAKEQDDAVRLIYRMADRECALVLETIGESCELVSVNTSVSANEDGARTPSVRASGSFSMKVRLKR